MNYIKNNAGELVISVKKVLETQLMGYYTEDGYMLEAYCQNNLGIDGGIEDDTEEKSLVMLDLKRRYYRSLNLQKIEFQCSLLNWSTFVDIDIFDSDFISCDLNCVHFVNCILHNVNIYTPTSVHQMKFINTTMERMNIHIVADHVVYIYSCKIKDVNITGTGMVIIYGKDNTSNFNVDDNINLFYNEM